jgi:hypothetical protein
MFERGRSFYISHPPPFFSTHQPRSMRTQPLVDVTDCWQWLITGNSTPFLGCRRLSVPWLSEVEFESSKARTAIERGCEKLSIVAAMLTFT